MELGQKILELVKEDPAAEKATEVLSPLGEVYVVGGAPRDVVLGKDPKDIDMMARIDGKVIEEALGAVNGGSVILTGKQFPVYRFHYGDSEVEIALPRTEKKSGEGNKDWEIVFGPEITVEQDLERRDFTVNAIAVNAVTGEVVDPFGGIQDLENGTFQTVSDTSFRDDSSRVMRALTQMSKRGLEPIDGTRDQMKQYAEFLTNSPSELIQAELDKILEGGNPHAAIRLAFETGVLKEFLPEVFDAFGFDQKNRHHSLELGEHLLAVLEGTLDSDDPDLRLAALLHDIGKPGSQWIDDEGFAHYYKKIDENGIRGEQHEDLGADLARERMKALRYPNDRIENVEWLIRNHMFPAFSNARGARKFLQNAGSLERAMTLLDLRAADLAGKGRDLTTTEETQSVQRMRDLVTQEHDKQSAFSLKDLAINGRDVIDATGAQGSEIGRKLKALLEMVVDDPSLNNRETLLGLVKTASQGSIYRVVNVEVPDEEFGRKAAEKRLTKEDLDQVIDLSSPVGVWWWTENLADKEDIEGYGNREELVRKWVSDTGEYTGEILIMLVADRPADFDEDNEWEDEYHSEVQLTGLRYDAGWGWVPVRIDPQIVKTANMPSLLEKLIQKYIEADSYDYWDDVDIVSDVDPYDLSRGEFRKRWEESVGEKPLTGSTSDFRDRDYALGSCGLASKDFSEFLVENGFPRENVSVVQVSPSEYYPDALYLDTDGHCVVRVVTSDGVFDVDWTVAQFGKTDFPYIRESRTLTANNNPDIIPTQSRKGHKVATIVTASQEIKKMKIIKKDGSVVDIRRCGVCEVPYKMKNRHGITATSCPTCGEPV